MKTPATRVATGPSDARNGLADIVPLALQGDPAPPPRPTTEEITVKEIVIVADPTLVTAAINQTLDVIWTLLPAATLTGLAWV